MLKLEKHRDLTPDIIKGVLILLMVYGHTTIVGSLVSFQNGAVDLIYTFHMQIFFALSGFYFFSSFSKKLDLQPLIRRLFIPYVVFEILYLFGLIAIQYVGIGTSNPAPSSLTDFAYRIFVRPIGAYWFVFDLFLMQFAIILGRYICERYNDSSPLSAIVVGGLIIAIVSQVVYFPEKAYIYFFMGLLLGVLQLKFWNFSYLGAIPAVIFAIWLQEDVFAVSFTQMIWCGSIATCIGLIGKTLPWKIQDVLVWMGRNTILVLVLHAAFIVASKPIAPLFLRVDQTGILFTLFSTGLAVMGSIFFGILFDRMRLSSILFGKRNVYVKFASTQNLPAETPAVSPAPALPFNAPPIEGS